jgi:alpha-galactosidase
LEALNIAKITLIGAGSLVFTRNLCNDILLMPTPKDCEIVLMDIDPQRLELAHALIQSLVERRASKVKVSATLDPLTAPVCVLPQIHDRVAEM